MRMREFYAKLTETRKRFNWRIDSDGELRATLKGSKSGVDFCPITAVHYLETKEKLDSSDFMEANRKSVRLHHRHRDRIIGAADEPSDHKQIRNKLLSAVDVEEKEYDRYHYFCGW
jgi:hypothetical protein